MIERRSAADDAKKKDKIANEKVQPMIQDILDSQKSLLFAELDSGGRQVKGVLAMADDDWIETIREVYLDVGTEFGKDIVVEKREAEDPLRAALDDETDILREKTDIQEATIEKIDTQMKEGVRQGWSTAQLQQAILDCGIFESARALRIARTITGAAASAGQWLSGMLAGANAKRWLTAGDNNVRALHQRMDNELRPIKELYSNGGRYPGDSLLSAAERINCRCSQLFEIIGDMPFTTASHVDHEEAEV